MGNYIMKKVARASAHEGLKVTTLVRNGDGVGVHEMNLQMAADLVFVENVRF
jgi:hypothetical protein